MSSHFLFLYTMIVYSLIIVNSILNLSTTLFEYALFVYNKKRFLLLYYCLLYTSDAADE